MPRIKPIDTNNPFNDPILFQNFADIKREKIPPPPGITAEKCRKMGGTWLAKMKIDNVEKLPVSIVTTTTSQRAGCHLKNPKIIRELMRRSKSTGGGRYQRKDGSIMQVGFGPGNKPVEALIMPHPHSELGETW
jgi:hypothetical protein